MDELSRKKRGYTWKKSQNKDMCMCITNRKTPDKMLLTRVNIFQTAQEFQE